ncbi:contact-dependent growth inhibition system immunity protein [Chryseolinea lacunae]|uniref:CdiI family contact-dependent growth inhibition immunity protein n=1 Tax=Chryseolinea lacunae TaxID=2801331 RepID=A0ABS1KRU3_9BACT|nr:contact-dependent growth inhibition system immunity protein [Chryseolinea lacunae]MBL0741397.1 CdiI family contact-dependent growth inhibition immunity protein [Chryseolinea lacunae]
MNILEIFKLGQKKHKPKVLGAGATLYPDKIVIETVDRIKDSYGIISTYLTILHPDGDSILLGQTLRHHLGQSRDDLKMTKDIDGKYTDYLKKAGFKNRKEHYRNALHLMISEKDGKIRLAPTINGGPTGKNRGFMGTKEEPISVDSNVSDVELGDMLKLGWSKCVCNCA